MGIMNDEKLGFNGSGFLAPNEEILGLLESL